MDTAQVYYHSAVSGERDIALATFRGDKAQKKAMKFVEDFKEWATGFFWRQASALTEPVPGRSVVHHWQGPEAEGWSGYSVHWNRIEKPEKDPWKVGAPDDELGGNYDMDPA